MKHSVKLVLVIVFLCLSVVGLYAQQKHFIYVQSDDKQQFAIVLNGKVYSSSDYGYIIIPGLADGEYNFKVSFPMNKFPEQAFNCTVNKKDVGFFLKNNNDAWVLQNMQTKAPVAGNNTTAASNDAFGSMLAGAVSDTTLLQENNAEKTVADVPATGNLPGAAVATAAATAVAVTATDAGAIHHQPQKIAEIKADTGTNMLFVDNTGTGVDTINVFVPAGQETAGTNTVAENSSATPGEISQPADNAAIVAVPVVVDASGSNEGSGTDVSADTTAVGGTEQVIPDTTAHELSNPFYKPEQPANTAAAIENTGEIATGATTATVAVSNAVKEDCAHTISDDDLNKMKRKMFVQHGDNEMIQYAIKYLNNKCITTSQVKVLGGLFMSDDGRYNFYDAMYKLVYDYGNYPQLAGQIVDPYYKKRFAAMLR